MATLEELQGRLAMLHESLDELRGLIERLAAGVRPAGRPEADDLLDEDAVADLAAEISDGLRDAHDEQELLQEDLADLADPTTTTTTTTTTQTRVPTGASHDRARLRAGLARLDQELQTQHAAFRKARLQARQSLEQTQRRERQAVLAAYVYEEEEEEDEEDEERGDRRDVRSAARASSTARRKPPSATAAAAADVTAALRQTHARIAGEVARSDFAAQTLAESSRALTELGDRYGSGGSNNSKSGGGADIASSLQSARHLVGGLVAAHKSDTWYLQTALYLLLATVGWLLFRRLLYGPLWLLVWWPVRTAWAALATAVGLGRAGAGLLTHDTSASSILATPSSLANSPLVRAETPVVSGSTAMAASATPSTSTDSDTAPDTDSLVEQVGQIVDGHGSNTEDAPADANSQQGSQDSQDSQEPPQRNPMKRMWEEDVEAAKYEAQQKEEKEHTRDEL